MPEITWTSMKKEKVSAIVPIHEAIPAELVWQTAATSLLQTVVDELVKNPPPHATVRGVKRLPDRVRNLPGLLGDNILVAEFEAEILFPEDWKMSYEDEESK